MAGGIGKTVIVDAGVPLKPCPNCGKVPVIKARVNEAGELRGFVCPKDTVCHGSGVYSVFEPESQDKAVAWWNTRAPVMA